MKYLLSLLLLCPGLSFAASVSLEDFSAHVDRVIAGHYGRTDADVTTKFKQLPNTDCKLSDYDDQDYLMDPICIAYGQYPTMDFQTAVNLTWDHIADFQHVYDLQATGFEYEPTQPVLTTDYTETLTRFEDIPEAAMTALRYQYQGDKIIVPKKLIAFENLKDFGFYAVKKQNDFISKCERTNYSVAIKQVDGTYLEPGETFDLNKAISNQEGQCKGSGAEKHIFYGGSCGASTHMFRLSLLMPSVDVVERHNHSVRWATYYGDYIYGDDAAMYEYNKQFVIQNDGQWPIYYRLLYTNDSNTVYLVGITPHRSQYETFITKNQTGPRSALVTKSIVDPSDQSVIKYNERATTYTQKHYGIN